MEIKELREKGKSELIKLLKEARMELVKLNLDRRSGSLANGSVLEKKRKEIARILTVLKEKEILEEARGEVRSITQSPNDAKFSKRPAKAGKGTSHAKKKT